MSKKANPALIGAFVVGGLGLLVVVLLVVGGTRLFSASQRFVLFFPGAVNGLSVGAPVEFRGVRIGSVVDIQVVYETDNAEVLIPVTIEIVDQKLDERQPTVGKSLPEIDSDELLERMVLEDGLRGNLKVKSLLTGQVIVQFDFFPDSELQLRDISTRYPQLPTTTSGIEELANALNDFPVRTMLAKTGEIVDRLHRLVTSGAADQVLDNAALASEEAKRLLIEAREQLAILGAGLDTTLEVTQARLSLEQGEPLYQLNRTLERFDELGASLQDEVGPTAEQVRKAVAEAGRASRAASEAMAGLRDLVHPNAPLFVDMSRALRSLRNAADSVRNLADFLERNPDAMLRGKSTRR